MTMPSGGYPGPGYIGNSQVPVYIRYPGPGVMGAYPRAQPQPQTGCSKPMEQGARGEIKASMKEADCVSVYLKACAGR